MPENLPLTSDPLQQEKLEDTLALCLSGGGYRAMLFHLGSLWKLNEWGYLPKRPVDPLQASVRNLTERMEQLTTREEL